MKLRTILMSNFVFICGAWSIRITRTTYLKEKYQCSILLSTDEILKEITVLECENARSARSHITGHLH